MLYSFPTEDNLREEWKAEIGKVLGKGSNWKVEKKDYVCSLHFLGGRKLGANKIPTIFCQTTRESSDEATILDDNKENKENIKLSIESGENDDAENENQNPLDHHHFSDDLQDSTRNTDNAPKPSTYGEERNYYRERE